MIIFRSPYSRTNYSLKDIMESVFRSLWEENMAHFSNKEKLYKLFFNGRNMYYLDHISFRTLNFKIQGLTSGIKGFEKIVNLLGYTLTKTYEFPSKNLISAHFEHFSKEMPKLYVSEIYVSNFINEELFELLKDEYKKQINPLFDNSFEEFKILKSVGIIPVNKSEIIIKTIKKIFTNKWNQELIDRVESLNHGSNYLNWVMENGNIPHHFAFGVNNFDSLENLTNFDEVITELRELDIKINNIYADPKERIKKILIHSDIDKNVDSDRYIEILERKAEPPCSKELSTKPTIFNLFLEEKDFLNIPEENCNLKVKQKSEKKREVYFY